VVAWGGIEKSSAPPTNTDSRQFVLLAWYAFGYTKLVNGSWSIFGFEPTTPTSAQHYPTCVELHCDRLSEAADPCGTAIDLVAVH